MSEYATKQDVQMAMGVSSLVSEATKAVAEKVKENYDETEQQLVYLEKRLTKIEAYVMKLEKEIRRPRDEEIRLKERVQMLEQWARARGRLDETPQAAGEHVFTFGGPGISSMSSWARGGAIPQMLCPDCHHTHAGRCYKNP